MPVATAAVVDAAAAAPRCIQRHWGRSEDSTTDSSLRRSRRHRPVPLDQQEQAVTARIDWLAEAALAVDIACEHSLRQLASIVE